MSEIEEKEVENEDNNTQDDPLELEHAIGYTGENLNSLKFHPINPNLIIYPIGSIIVIEDLKDSLNFILHFKKIF
jgi:hypothetical protein